ncbi:MAG: aldo/keto reductase [Verrucomicrobiae bacterium]|nr:aldo/keto reductase [Verrucomicrobiae bacterium]MDW7978956.1 aldo/keto reductase [Verrucomicrobiales bacterium]
MNHQAFSRRQFIKTATGVAGLAIASRVFGAAPNLPEAVRPKRTAVDQVPLGKTGLKLSRLGVGTGSNTGWAQTALGKQGFIKLVHAAFDKGITYIDTAETYQTFEWIGDAIKGLPREKLFVQSKIPGRPEDVLAAIDRHRKTFNTDYIDSLLIHCMVRGNWTEEWRRVMDAFDQAKERKWIRAKGVSCHTLPALRAAAASDWPEVHLVRVNPQGKFIDGEKVEWGALHTNDIAPVMEQVKKMHAKGCGVIGMKIIGNGTFTDAADRDKAIRFAMACPDIDAIVIGFTTEAEIDEAIERMNRALAEV